MDRTRNSIVMENSVQQKIKDLSDEVKKLARDILKEKALKDLRYIKEKYSESKPGLIYDGEINNVYSRLSAIRDEWNSLYYQDTIDRRKGQFKIACACFEKYFTSNEQITIEKCMKIYSIGNRRITDI